MARDCGSAWMHHLPLVLLGVRTSPRQDTSWCPAELVYGATLRLPGEFVAPLDSPAPAPPSSEFVSRLRADLASMRPAPSSHHRRPAPSADPLVPAALRSVTHVYVRVDAVRRPLVRPYEGPFLVQHRSAKTFTLSRAGKSWVVSVDRLKPAFSLPDFSPSTPCLPPPAPTSAGSPTSPAPSPDPADSALDPSPDPSPDPLPFFQAGPRTTRSGRTVRPPARFQDY